MIVVVVQPENELVWRAQRKRQYPRVEKHSPSPNLYPLLTNLFWWNWIVSAKVPWMATKNAFASEDNPVRNTVKLYGFFGISATRWVKTTKSLSGKLSQEPVVKRECFLVEAYKKDENSF